MLGESSRDIRFEQQKRNPIFKHRGSMVPQISRWFSLRRKIPVPVNRIEHQGLSASPLHVSQNCEVDQSPEKVFDSISWNKQRQRWRISTGPAVAIHAFAASVYRFANVNVTVAARNKIEQITNEAGRANHAQPTWMQFWFSITAPLTKLLYSAGYFELELKVVDVVRRGEMFA